jgi:hypothetical protein
VKNFLLDNLPSRAEKRLYGSTNQRRERNDELDGKAKY